MMHVVLIGAKSERVLTGNGQAIFVGEGRGVGQGAISAQERCCGQRGLTPNLA
ncbi:MAG: hypothetical protein AAGA73_16470 [Pseudomonadota bacterium]